MIAGRENHLILGDLTVDQDSAVPIYYQLAEAIRAKIEAKALRPGDQLPPERVIAEHFGISRMTVRQAMQRLEQDGILAKRRGAGTFVATPRVTASLRWLRGFSSEVGRQRRTAIAEILDLEVRRPDDRLRRTLSVPDLPGSVIRIRRRRRLENRPVSLETSWLPTHLCKALLDVDLSGRSLYQALREVCGLRLAAGHERLTAAVLDTYEARLLETEPGKPAMLVERITTDDQQRPVEFVRTLLRGDLVAFEAPLTVEESGI